MSQWIERIEGHPAIAGLKALREVLALTKEKCVADETLLNHWDRARHFERHLTQVFSRMDALLVPPVTMDKLSSHINQISAEISGFQNTGNVTHWNNTQTNIDSALSYLCEIPRIRDQNDVVDFREAASSYRISVEELLQGIRVNGEDISRTQAVFRKQLDDFSVEVSAQKQRLDNAIATFQEQFLDAQNSRISDYTESESQRAEHFSQIEANRDQIFEKTITDANEKFEALETHFNLSCMGILEAMERNKLQAEKIAGIISNTGMVSGYQKTANEERAEARTWKIVASGSLIVWIIIGVVFFALTYDKDLTWAAVARQFLISTPFVLLAGFAAMQVSRHQKSERQHRQAELEIASIDPFLATLSAEERNQAKREFAARHFGQREFEGKTVETGEGTKMLDLLGDLTKGLREVQQAVTKK